MSRAWGRSTSPALLNNFFAVLVTPTLRNVVLNLKLFEPAGPSTPKLNRTGLNKLIRLWLHCGPTGEGGMGMGMSDLDTLDRIDAEPPEPPQPQTNHQVALTSTNGREFWPESAGIRLLLDDKPSPAIRRRPHRTPGIRRRDTSVRSCGP